MNDIYINLREAVVYWIHLPEHNDIFSQGYVGVSRDLKKRKSKHQQRLLKGQHNKHFQNATNLYGLEKFIWDVILFGEENYCYEIEENLRPIKNIGWNAERGGLQPPDTSGTKLTKEHKEKLSISSKGRIKSEDERRKLSESLKGHKVSEEQILKYKKSRSKNPKSHFIITFPNGIEELIVSLSDFCKKHNLSYKSIYRIIEGRYKEYNGFKIKYAYPELH